MSGRGDRNDRDPAGQGNAETPEPLFLANLTSPQTADALRHVEMVLIPIGAHEQHGPALPVSTDTLTAQVLSTLAGTLLTPRVAVAPAVPWGVSWHHQGRAGTLSLREETLIAIVVDLIDSLVRQGVQRVVLVNTHGGNRAALTIAAERAKREMGIPLVVPLYAYTFLEAAASDVLGADAIGHAGGDEASAILAIRPELVDQERLENPSVHTDVRLLDRLVAAAGGSLPVMMHKVADRGATGDSSGATTAAGHEILGKAASSLRSVLETLLDANLDAL